MSNTLLIIEDEPLLGVEMRRRFVKQGWEVILVNDVRSARHQLHDKLLRPLVVLADMILPDGNCLDLLEGLKQQNQPIGEWILLTAYGSISDSVRALKLGAHDFLEKPVDDARLDMAIQRATRSARAQRRLSNEVASRAARYGIERLIGHSDRIVEIRQIVQQIAQTNISALVLRGDTGTGKGLVARILHYAGPRAAGPMVEVNCAALPGELLESELFGHEAGAFTGAKGRREGLFEQADGGTLFLDEIAEMDLALQAKLLKAVEDRKIRRVAGNQEINIDVQIISATNRDLEAEVADKRFRSDLFHRLSVFQIELPSIADRPEDLEELVKGFVDEFNERAQTGITHIPQDVWTQLKSYSWPGNVRELRNVIERCVLLSRGPTLEARWLQLNTAPQRQPHRDENGIFFPLDGSISLDQMERRLIEESLFRQQGNVTKAAKLLGISRQTLRYRIEKHGLDPEPKI
ncbi:MAG: sigma-54-dependent Fis family transcriptional regulator [Gammaproteobacteria bacterium]|nr:sigma-54-dependent Fis family transcriptional regulator [Gammaproteobacteria bacterium]